LREQRVIDRPAGDGGDLQHVADPARLCLDSREQDVAKGLGERFTGLARRGKQFLGEEGVALGSLEQTIDERRRRGFVEDSSDLLAKLLSRERFQLEPGRSAAALELEHEWSQRMATQQLVA